MYRPKRPFTTPFMVLNPTSREVQGKPIKEYPETSKDIVFCSFVTYGGTEVKVNDLWTVQDTAILETWYRPDINADTRLMRMEDRKIYQPVSDPEDIEFRHQFLKFKVESVRGFNNG